MLDRLKKLFLEARPDADVSAVTESTDLKVDLGLDSMAMLMLAFNLEEEFGIEFGGDPVKLVTVGDVLNFIRSKGGK